MPLASRLVHRLAIVTPSVIQDWDDYNQPVPGPPTTELVDGFLWPLSEREQDQVNQAGAIVASHNVVIKPRTVSRAAWIRFDPDDGERYDITGIDEHNYGRDPLMVIHLNRVTVQDTVLVS